MLNSYKDLRRWFPALEPQAATSPGRPNPTLEETLFQGCAARYPHYITETEPEPFDIPFAGPRRSEFVGGWSDWVANGHAPPADGPPHDADLVRLPRDRDGADDDAQDQNDGGTPDERVPHDDRANMTVVNRGRRGHSEDRRTGSANERSESSGGKGGAGGGEDTARRAENGGGSRVAVADPGEEVRDDADRIVHPGADSGGGEPAGSGDTETVPDIADRLGERDRLPEADPVREDDHPLADDDRPDDRPAAGRGGRFRRRSQREVPEPVHPIGRADWLDEWPGESDDWLGGNERFGHTTWSGTTTWSDAEIPRRRRGVLTAARARWEAAGRAAQAAERRRAAESGADGPQAARTLREQSASSRMRIAIVLAVAVLLLAALGGFALYLLHSHNASHAERGRGSAVRLADATTGRVLYCPTERSGVVLRGADPGGTDSGPEAIMWFQHSYYVERSADRAWQVVAPGAAVPPVTLIQRGIDSVPRATAYCVRVIPLTAGTTAANTAGGNRFSVEVTELRPGGTPATYDRQTVTTAMVDGRTLITGITAG